MGYLGAIWEKGWCDIYPNKLFLTFGQFWWNSIKKCDRAKTSRTCGFVATADHTINTSTFPNRRSQRPTTERTCRVLLQFGLLLLRLMVTCLSDSVPTSRNVNIGRTAKNLELLGRKNWAENGSDLAEP